MKILDRYIFFKYIITFFFSLTLLLVITLVIDLSERTDDFARSGLGLTEIIKQYYAGYIPTIGALLFPLFVFISVIFFTSKMANRSEVIAILSSGISFNRYLRPFFAGAVLLAGIFWYGLRYVLPPANKIYGDFKKAYIDKSSSITAQNNSSYKQNIYFRIDRNSYLGIKSYDTISKSGYGIFIQEFKNTALSYNIHAPNFNWDTAKKQWRLTNASERFIEGPKERVVLYAEKFVKYDFTPVALRLDEYLKDQMTTPDLDRFIAMEKMRGSEMLPALLVERYNRDAAPVAILILTLIGASLASRKVRGGNGVHIALGVLLSMVYILFSRFSGVFGTKGDFPPLLAAWVPNICFGLLGIYLYMRAPK